MRKMADFTKLWAGIGIIMIFFVGGFIMMIMGLTSGDRGVGMILFWIFVVPIIGIVIGVPLIIKSMDGGPMGLFGSLGNRRKADESSYVHEPPSFCRSCGASLSVENVEWAGPLTVKCPYCGATMPTEKRTV
jgi:hypothetical protein